MFIMDEQELTLEQEKEVDDFLERAEQMGKEVSIELGEDFIKYLKIMLRGGVRNPKEQLIIFGIYILQNNVNKDGNKLISKNKFFNFFQEFKEKYTVKIDR